MQELDDNCIDQIVTDPDYGYDFMGKGKEWGGLPPVKYLSEMNRVLKAGSFAFFFSAPRQDMYSELVQRLAQANFITAFTSLYWTYASAIPKALNISKAIDKRFGLDREILVERYKATHHTGITYQWAKMKNETGYAPITLPTSSEANALNGAYGGYQPKPAIETIIVCMKPLSEATYVDQALKSLHNKTVGRGCTWLDDCRIPINPKQDDVLRTTKRKSRAMPTWDLGSGFKAEGNQYSGVRPSGRFPAHLLVSDDILDDGEKHSQGHWSKSKVTGYGEYGGGTEEYYGVGEKQKVDSFSRYFSLDDWWQYKCKITKLPKSVQRTFPFMLVPKSPKSEKWFWCKRCKRADHSSQEKHHHPHSYHCITCTCDFRQQDRKIHHDHKIDTNIIYHITQKPRKIIAYLITLGSRAGDIILDPYVGSGTTPEQAYILRRKYLGFEIDPISFNIATARLKPVKSQKSLESFFS